MGDLPRWANRTLEVTVAILALVGLGALLYLLAESITLGSACGDTCNWQAWMGASSGYFAVIAASITAYFILGQFREARRQADFMIGQLSPTASLFDPRDVTVENAFANRLEIVNWNRDPVFVRAIVVQHGSPVEIDRVSVVDHDAARRHRLQAEYERGRMMIPGWRDRSRAPTFAEFDVSMSVPHKAVDVPARIADDLVRGKVDLAIKITIGGDSREDVVRATRADALLIVESE